MLELQIQKNCQPVNMLAETHSLGHLETLKFQPGLDFGAPTTGCW